MSTLNTAVLTALLLLLPSSALAQSRDQQQDTQQQRQEQQNQEQRTEQGAQTTADAVAVRSTVAVGTGAQNALVQRALNTLEEFKSQRLIPEERLANAQCIAIFPDVTEAALIVGAEHGDGIASCRSTDGKWSRIAFLDLVGASLGAQLGAKSEDLALLFMNDRAKSELQSGDFRLGADLSYVMGSRQGDLEIERDKDVVAYERDKGLFAGAALTGTVIKADQDELQAYYNEPVTIERTLTTYIVPDEPITAKQFIAALPKADPTITARDTTQQRR